MPAHADENVLTTYTSEKNMGGLAILLLILALVIGGVGLLVEGLMWLLIIAVVLAVVGAIAGRGKGRSGV
ncbi:hypothetical protein [Egicoccus sp. AB-alg6-2]|uniref:hypothetical protein n=1 Tax=Egicoccus sp. AB-alg6-2 TaxID=3242692 RepID=UPI00359EE738